MKLSEAKNILNECGYILEDKTAKLNEVDKIYTGLPDKIVYHNIIESVRGHNNYIPSVGLFYKFSFNVKNNEYLASRDWSESEMRVSAAYKNMYENVNAISTGVDIELGMKDTTPPQISIMIEE